MHNTRPAARVLGPIIMTAVSRIEIENRNLPLATTNAVSEIPGNLTKYSASK